MDPILQARLQKAIGLCDRAMLAIGLLMVAYIGTAAFGFLSSSARHYAAFMTFVMVMSGLAAFRVVIGERLGRPPVMTVAVRDRDLAAGMLAAVAKPDGR